MELCGREVEDINLLTSSISNCILNCHLSGKL